MKIVISDTPPYFLDLDAPTLPAYEALDEDGTATWCVCGACTAVTSIGMVPVADIASATARIHADSNMASSLLLGLRLGFAHSFQYPQVEIKCGAKLPSTANFVNKPLTLV